jgi:hypothetical protein
VQIELLPGLTNVVRFPLEERVRPSLDLLLEIEPDVNEVSLVAEGFQLDGPDYGLMDAADEATAEYIAEHILPLPQPEQRAQLDAVLEHALKRAVAACRAAHGAATRAVSAEKALHAATVEGGYWLAPLQERASLLTQRNAELLIAAYDACQEAYGVSRAVWCARRGETWEPRNMEADVERFLLGK